MEAVATTIVGEQIATGVVGQIKHQFSFLSQYQVNIDNLSSKVSTLEVMREDVQDQVNAAMRNLQEIKGGVNNWLAKVPDTKAEVEGILADIDKVGKGCWQGWCLNLNLRYQLSRKAMKEAIKINALLEEGAQFKTVAHPQLPSAVVSSYVAEHVSGNGIASSSSGARGVLESRESILRDVMEAVKDDQIRIVRIIGMGGVGKTTMAKEVEKIAREERLFDEIPMVELNHEPDLGIIQDDLANSLGLDLEECSSSARALQLRKRLNDKSKRILLILDNVWKREDLEEVGVPLGDEGGRCKILLTSRKDNVCERLATEKVFKIGFLPVQEAWNLFLHSLGHPVDYVPIAKGILQACGGLPLAIKTIARAVANKSETAWRVALRKLQKSTTPEGENKAVFNTLKVSYDFLNNKEIQKLFRLCCLFPKGRNVPIENLVRYGMALRLFGNIDKLYEARDEANANVETLVQSNLLLGGSDARHVKIHDVVWNFALSLTSEGPFMVKYGDGLEEWPRRESCADYTLMSLQCGNMHELPDWLNFTRLEILKLFGEEPYYPLKFPENLYEGMVGLRALVFDSIYDPLNVKSLLHLANLRTLCLTECNLENNVSMIGNLENLEVLSLACSSIEELPTEIGNLRRLRLFDLTGCRLKLKSLGILSRLTSLEELYTEGKKWDVEELGAMFTELSSLPKMLVIVIEIPSKFVPPVDSLFEKVERFRMSFGCTLEDKQQVGYKVQNTLKLMCETNVLLESGMKLLLGKTENMDLEVRGLEVLVNESEMGRFSNMKTLSVESCSELVYLINTRRLHKDNLFPCLDSLHLLSLGNLEEIYHVQNSKESFSELTPVDFFAQPPSFRCLTIISVSSCSKLERIFPLHIARALVMLKEIYILSCEMMTEIFWKERGHKGEKASIGKIQFPNLRQLSLAMLPNLVGFCEAADEVELPQLEELNLSELPKLTSLFPETETLASEDDDVSVSCHLFNQKGPQVRGFQNLRSLTVGSCSSLRQLFTHSLAISFRELYHLELNSCISLKAIVSAEAGKNKEECVMEEILFPKLTHLLLDDLPELSTIMPKGCTFRWSSLKKLKVESCGGGDIFANMKIVHNGTSVEKMALTNLEELEIRGMNSIELWRNILSIHFSSDLVRGFHQLKTLHVGECDSLELIFDVEELIIRRVTFNQLEHMYLRDLPRMTHVWKKCPPSFEGFHNLTGLSVERCHSLRYLFSPSIAKCLVKLQWFFVIDCEAMEEIVSKRDEEVEEDQRSAIDIPFFPYLNSLKLVSLPRLVCLGVEACAINKLSLEAQNVGCSETEQEGNASTSTSSPIFNDKSSNPTSSALVGIGICQFPTWSLHNLARLSIHECHQLSCVFPPNIEVFLPVLQTLSIVKCDSLRYVFRSSMVRSLVQLRHLHIEECEKLEVIVDEEDEAAAAEDRMNKLVFPHLISMELEMLPRLTGISSGMLAFEWPSLTCLEINFCWKMRIFTSGCSTTPILGCVIINEQEHSLEDRDLDTTLTSAQQKFHDFLEFKENGVLTITGFLDAGEHLAAECPSWSWESGESHKAKNWLLGERQFLIARNVPCLRRARASSSKVVVEEDKNENEADKCSSSSGIDDENIPRPRIYDVSITYDVIHQTPRLWLTGYDVESKVLLPLELVLEDIAEIVPRELIAAGDHPHLDGTHVSLYPADLPPHFIKNFSLHLSLHGFQPNVCHYLQLFLDIHALGIPTIQYRFC